MSEKNDRNEKTMFGAAQALGRIDDSLIAEGEIEGLTVGKTESGWSRVTRSGWFAAAVCALFAAAAVGGMILLGRGGGAAGPGVAGTSGEQGTTAREVIKESETQPDDRHELDVGTEAPSVETQAPGPGDFTDARMQLPLRIQVVRADGTQKTCTTVGDAKQAILDAAAEGRALLAGEMLAGERYEGGSVLADFAYDNMEAYEQLMRAFGRWLVSMNQQENGTYAASLSFPLDEMYEVTAEELCLQAASADRYTSVIVSVVMDRKTVGFDAQINSINDSRNKDTQYRVYGVSDPTILHVDAGEGFVNADGNHLGEPVGVLSAGAADLAVYCGDMAEYWPELKSWVLSQCELMEEDPAYTVVRVFVNAVSGSVGWEVSGVTADFDARTVNVTVDKYVPEIGTDDLAQWVLLVPVTLAPGADISEWTVNVKVNTIKD